MDTNETSNYFSRRNLQNISWKKQLGNKTGEGKEIWWNKDRKRDKVSG